MNWIKKVLMIIVGFCSGSTDYNNNNIPDSHEVVEQVKKYLDLQKNKNKLKEIKRETKNSQKMLKRIFK